MKYSNHHLVAFMFIIKFTGPPANPLTITFHFLPALYKPQKSTLLWSMDSIEIKIIEELIEALKYSSSPVFMLVIVFIDNLPEKIRSILMFCRPAAPR